MARRNNDPAAPDAAPPAEPDTAPPAEPDTAPPAEPEPVDPGVAAARVGMAPREIWSAVLDNGHLVVRCTDGTVLVDVPADAPDAAGKTGLMFLEAPLPPPDAEGRRRPYTGSFPVYVPHPEES